MNIRNHWILGLAALGLAVAGCDDGGGDDMDAGPGTDGEVVPEECPTGLELCGAECVSTDTNRSHCGACDTACDVGEACTGGSCGLVCPDGQEICDGACVDTDTDRAHCGACGTACGAGESCAAGACELSCPTGQVVCDGACVDTDSNPAHCGDCATACEAGEVCDSGSCAVSCSAGLAECDGACVDFDVDPDHCGDCATACTADAGATPLCTAGTCSQVCDARTEDCNNDLGEVGGDGCETPVGTDPRNCGACGRVCSFPDAVAGCADGACTLATCASGFGDCDGDFTNGCETDVAGDELNCGACGTVCTSGDACILGACMSVLGEDCGSVITLTDGTNTVAWDAFLIDYLTTRPSCTLSYDVRDADVVLSYTVSTSGTHTFTTTPPSSNRWVMVLSRDTCGTVTEEACDSQFGSTMEFSAFLSAGETVYLYVASTDSGSSSLSDPFDLTITPPSCGSPTAPVVTDLSPPDGGTTATLSPTFEVTFDAPVYDGAGTITVTGDAGTSLTYDLSTAPSEVSFDASGTVMTVDPGMAFPSGEALTISVSGLVGLSCGEPVAMPSWAVDVLDCSTFAGPSAIALDPPDGSTASSLSPPFEATFDVPIDTSTGTVTLTGDMGTVLTYDLSTSPAEVSFSASEEVMTITPAVSFAPFENVTVSWTGIVDPVCGNVGPAPTWSVDIPCADLDTDPANCGSCGNMCAAGETCVGGTCSTCPGMFVGGTCVYLPSTVSASDKTSARAECTALGGGFDLCPASILCDPAVGPHLVSSGCDCSGGGSTCACSGSVNLYVHVSDTTTSDRAYYIRGSAVSTCGGSDACTVSTSATCGVALCCR